LFEELVSLVKFSLPAESWLKLFAQFLTIACIFASLAYAGATTPMIQWWGCLGVLSALVCALLSLNSRSRYPKPKAPRSAGASLAATPRDTSVVYQLGGGRTTALLIFAWFLFLIWTAAGTISLPETLVNSLSPLTASLRSELSHPDSVAKPPSTWSVIPHRTVTDWPPLAIGLGCFLLGVIAFPTREDRQRLMVAVVAGGTAFAAWGLINRSKGLNRLLPGIDAPEMAQPFSTLVYKNAGAAILMLVFAVTLGLLLETLRPAMKESSRRLAKEEARRREEGSERSSSEGRQRHSNSDGYSSRGAWAEPGVFGILAVLALLVVAIVFSLSRGIWIVGSISILTWMFCLRSWFTPRAWFFGLLFLAILTTAVFLGMRNRDIVTKRMDQLAPAAMETGRVEHYRDAVATLPKFLITGAGLGNYGYVQLLGQKEDTPRWFSHAHSMPIEWLVETGIPGILLTLIGLAALTRLILRLYRHRFHGTSYVISFSVALIASLTIVLQSLFDFTILTPAVLWAYALVLGAVLSTSRSSTSTHAKPSTIADSQSKATSRYADWSTRPLPWIVLVGICLLVAQTWLQRAVINERVLAANRVPNFDLLPSQNRITKAISALESRIAQSPHDSRLHQQLGHWHAADFRYSLVNLAAANKAMMTWNDTSSAIIFQSYFATPPQDREATRALWLSEPGSVEKINRAIQCFDHAIAANPLLPQTHLDQLLWHPISQRAIEPSFKAAEKVAVAEGELQYHLGWIAYCRDDKDSMIEHWRRALVHSPQRTGVVIALAASKLTKEEVSSSILGSLRPEVWISLIRTSLNEPAMDDFAQPFEKNALASIQKSTSLNKAQAAYLSGQVYELYDRHRDASKHYLIAVENDRSNVEYRYRAAHSLWKTGDLKEARKQLVLAKALDTQNARANELIQKLDRQTQRELNEKSPLPLSPNQPKPSKPATSLDAASPESSSKTEKSSKPPVG
jgi:tetratricopeptide (TPR) repeat protein